MTLFLHCLLDMLIVFGFLTAICVIGGCAVYLYAVCLWRLDQRRATVKLKAIDREIAGYEAEAQRLGAFKDQLLEIRALPIADPWDVA